MTVNLFAWAGCHFSHDRNLNSSSEALINGPQLKPQEEYGAGEFKKRGFMQNNNICERAFIQ